MSGYTINHKYRRMAENITKIATPASATTEDIATKVNALIQALIDSKQMRSE